MDLARDEFQLVFEEPEIIQDPVVTPERLAPGAEDFGDPVPVLGVRSLDRVHPGSIVACTGRGGR